MGHNSLLEKYSPTKPVRYFTILPRHDTENQAPPLPSACRKLSVILDDIVFINFYENRTVELSCLRQLAGLFALPITV